MIHLRLQITPISYVVSRHRSLSLSLTSTKSKKLYEEYYSERDGCSASPSTEMATVIRLPVSADPIKPNNNNSSPLKQVNFSSPSLFLFFFNVFF